MRPDAVTTAALQRAIFLSADIEMQLASKAGGQPVVAILHRAREAAAAAIVALAETDPEQPSAIRTLQNDVRCFDRIVGWLREIVADGFQASDQVDLATREELAGAIGLTDDDLPETED